MPDVDPGIVRRSAMSGKVQRPTVVRLSSVLFLSSANDAEQLRHQADLSVRSQCCYRACRVAFSSAWNSHDIISRPRGHRHATRRTKQLDMTGPPQTPGFSEWTAGQAMG